jgi:hypothetical protein
MSGRQDGSCPSLPLDLAVISSFCAALQKPRLAARVANWAIVQVKKGRIKSEAAGQFCVRMLADIVQKGPKKGRILIQLFLSSYILSYSREVSKKYCYFATHTDKNSVFLKPNSFKKGKLLGPEFFHSAAEFFFWTGRKVLDRVGNIAGSH